MSKIDSIRKMTPSAWRAKGVWLLYQIIGFWWKRKQPGFFRVRHGKLFLEPSEGLRAFLRRCDAWEPEVIDKLNEVLRQGDVVLDFGSNYGEYAIQIADRVGPKGKVIGIEMDPHYCLLLQMVREYNPKLKDRMQFFEMMLSPKQGIDWIYSQTKLMPTFYFADIEGAEEELFKQVFSNPKWLAHSPRFLIEFHPEHYGEKTAKKLLDAFTAHGYRYDAVGPKHYYFYRK